ncbi:hypothetical protein [Nannocystis bainbridge]|uniref:Tannase/feruloyl esterase family alpha/beta hydrolase n=1 Tax=Nannocystis bainbridge TaxID=2995303 RepID=A0ABT5DWX2_9BACT|nr:hypothetical protein [Nannocystis bainbridge]MDC0718106.1 hypothetical protein [Nannocystis bainbridge]
MPIRSALPTSLALLVACGDAAVTTTETGTGTDTSSGTTDGTDATTAITGTTVTPTTGEPTTTTGDTATTTTGDSTTTEDTATTTGEPVDTTTTTSTSTGPDTTTDPGETTTTGDLPPDLDALLVGLDGGVRLDWLGEGDGGIEHSTYWALVKGSAEYNALPPAEQKKVDLMKASVLHSAQRVPTSQTPGVEITGALTIDARTQEIVLAVPTDYNGRLVVLGTPGTRDQWSSHGVLLSWLVARGYAVVVGNKGMTNGGVDGNATMLNKQHPSQHWGAMLIDLGQWAGDRLTAAHGEAPTAIYAAGLSNGAYQVRRALELDRLRVLEGEAAVFAGGLDWAGVYWPDARVLDTDADDTVTPAELAAGDHLIRTNEAAAMTMRYAYDPQTETTPANYAQIPPYPNAQAAMQAGGFDPASAPIWGAYNTAFDYLKGFGLPQFKGVGYYNFTGYVFRAELMGHDATEAAAYSCYTGPNDAPPAMYAWLAQAQDAGFTAEHVTWALANATTGEFSVPLISVHGDADGLNAFAVHAQSYRAAVAAFGTPSQHRLYVVSHGGHVDAHSDGLGLDFDFDGTIGEEGAADRFVLMQPYAERAFLYLVDWVENQVPAPAGKTLATDPASDVLDAESLAF